MWENLQDFTRWPCLPTFFFILLIWWLSMTITNCFSFSDLFIFFNPQVKGGDRPRRMYIRNFCILQYCKYQYMYNRYILTVPQQEERDSVESVGIHLSFSLLTQTTPTPHSSLLIHSPATDHFWLGLEPLPFRESQEAPVTLIPS